MVNNRNLLVGLFLVDRKTDRVLDGGKISWVSSRNENMEPHQPYTFLNQGVGFFQLEQIRGQFIMN